MLTMKYGKIAKKLKTLKTDCHLMRSKFFIVSRKCQNYLNIKKIF